MKLVILYDAYARRIFALLALICTISAFAYGFFLLEAVGHTASRAHAAQEIKALRGKLSSAETSYLALTQTLTPSRAEELGFTEPARTSTIYATDVTRVLTLGTTLP